MRRPTRTLVAVLVVLWPAVALARAGGGGGFHSSGHSSGGGGGHGDSGWVVLVYDLVMLCLRHPEVGVPVLAVVGGIVLYLWWNSTGTAAPTPNLGTTAVDAGAVGRLAAADPQFDADAFCRRVGGGFMKLQEAWCGQDLRAVRPFLSDGVHERFAIQFAEQKAAGYHDRMGNVGIDRITIADAATDAVYDSVAVRVVAHAQDQRVTIDGERLISGDPAVEPFAEVWSFLRRRGARTTPGKAGLLEGNCPNCGAPVAMNESANCASCGALLRSGQYDWVLSEITQASEWRPGQQARVPGLDALRQRDPDLNVQAIEDTASVVFWRRAEADRVGKIDPLRKAATDEYLKVVAGELRPGPDGRRAYTGECAVGSVRTVGFLPAEAGQAMDRAVVDVTWTGTRFEVAGDGRPAVPQGERTTDTLLVLGRAAGATTDVAKGISSAHCPQCGAPDDGGAGGACPYCGAVLNDGSHGWVLVDVQPRHGPVTAELNRVGGI